MVTRQRKPTQQNLPPNSTKTNIPQETKPVPETKESDRKSFTISLITSIIGICCIGTASYFGYIGYLETRVNTPFDSQKIVQDSNLGDGKYWGSYRPGTYFGLKTRDYHSLVAGLMWYFPAKLSQITDIRHWCEIGDRLDKYGWTQHDGRSFGVQEIHDGNFLLETSFVKFPIYNFEDWTARIKITTKHPTNEKVTIIWYVALDEKTDGWIKPKSGTNPSIVGQTKKLGKFEIDVDHEGKVYEQSYVSTKTPGLEYLRETIAKNLKYSNTKNEIKFQLIGDDGEIFPNFIAIQLTVTAPAVIDIQYRSSNITQERFSFDDAKIGSSYTEILNKKKTQFSKKFESVFHLVEKGFNQTDIDFAHAAFSNMIGGIGYFYGSSKVQSTYTQEPVPYWKAPLFSAVPSRSFFPRGFLWDEGFHGLLLSSWDIDIELDIMNHWFDLMNAEGWIPREQILGVESLAKVPQEFVVQKNSNANPPTFFLVLKKMLDRSPDQIKDPYRLANLEKLYPRLQAWFNWFNTTQKGELPGTYRWRGREISANEINPKTLTSGLDDFPRSSHPDSEERHVDLRCWVAFAAGVMVDIANLLGRNCEKYQATFDYLSNNELLDEQHLSPKTNTYADWGLHTDDVILKRPPPKQNQANNPDKVRHVLSSPEYQYVDKTFGYISLFPFLLKLLDANSPALKTILTDLRDESKLWTNYGIRSLSKKSPLYMQYNTEHDPPYWRGQIWININYLILSSLYHYSNESGLYMELSKSIYSELRQNVIANMINQYRKSGYIWENYNDKTGKGTGCHPFTGWSALIVLIMSEQY